jgi:RNA polymerase sigma-70 factor (ECF subfamily)
METPVQRDLVDAAMEGDHEAFSVLATGAANRLYGIARLILRDVDLSQDAVQETLVRAWRGLPGLRDPDRFDAWLHRLLVNVCMDLGRSRSRYRATVQLIVLDPPQPDDAGSIVDRDQIERAFRRLRPEQRAVVVLRYYLGLSLPEVSDTLSIPLGTTKSRLHYAIETMRAAIDADARSASVAGWTA